ncbi:hypothetical protein AHiyo8_pI68140 (plasmid) [Arthrobacter sp. Hiyo8]|nr:hypothetical protein AHiyo8_pI68140 [Arthrobacter sp. Hiyo8]
MAHPSVPASCIAFTANDRAHMDEQLVRSVNYLVEHALRRPETGILVTRHSPCDFTVEFHPDVPFGVTYERRNW